DTRQRYRFHWPRLSRSIQNVREILQRYFSLAINVDDVPEFLQRAKNKERINKQGKELSHRDRPGEDEVHHQEHDSGAQRVHRRSLDETQTAQVLHLLQFELQNLVGRAVQPVNLLLGQTKALDQFDVPQGLRRCTGEGRRFRNNDFLNFLDLAAQ